MIFRKEITKFCRVVKKGNKKSCKNIHPCIKLNTHPSAIRYMLLLIKSGFLWKSQGSACKRQKWSQSSNGRSDLIHTFDVLHRVSILFFWQTLSRSPKSKSKSRLMTGFSLKSDFPTTPIQPPTRESFKEARLSYTSKIKVVSLCKQVPKKFLSLTPTPKIAPKSPKRAKRPKIWPNEKHKDRAVLPKQKLIVYISRFQKYVLSDLDPKNSPKKSKKAQNLAK